MSNGISVHATHCCSQHGCKYYQEDCPVVLGQIEQVYPCEDCVTEGKRLDAAMRKAVLLGAMQDTPSMRSALREILAASDSLEEFD